MPDGKPRWLSAPISTTYGVPDAITGAPHNAVDFAVAPGTAVEAGTGGVVERVFHDAIGGNQVIIRTSDNYHITFAHLQQQLIQPGQSVTPATIIGQSGSSGRVTGPHLHVGVSDAKGAAVNPLDFFNGIIQRPGAGFVPSFELPRLPTPDPGVGDIRNAPPGAAPFATGVSPGLSLPDIKISVPGFEQVGQFFASISDFFQHGLWRAGFFMLGGTMFVVGFRMYTSETARSEVAAT